MSKNNAVLNSRRFEEKVTAYLKPYTAWSSLKTQGETAAYQIKIDSGYSKVVIYRNEEAHYKVDVFPKFVADDVNGRWQFIIPGLADSGRLGVDQYAIPDQVAELFTMWLNARIKLVPVELPGYLKNAAKYMVFRTDSAGDIIDDDGSVFYCSTLGCESTAKTRRYLSVSRPCDCCRNFCTTCSVIFDQGVRHGRFHEAAINNKPVSDSDPQSITSIPLEALCAYQ